MKSTLTLLLGLLLFSTLHAQVPAYVPTDGLVGWWPFNGNANDESGNGNDGVVYGAALRSDRNGSVNRSYEFFGSQWISINHNSSLNFDGDFSIQAWVNADSIYDTPGYIKTIVSKHVWGVNDGYTFSLVGASQDGSPTPYEGIIAFAASPNYNPSTVPNSDLAHVGVDFWCHTGMAYEAANQKLRYYINGQLVDSLFVSFDFNENSSNLIFGAISYDGLMGGTNFFNGQLDDIAIWNRALTSEEMQEFYTGTTPIAAPCAALPANLQEGIVGYWPFCGNANDESGNGNNGVVNGATLTEDRFGNANAAYGFDGVSSAIEIADAPNLSLLEDLTISCWFQYDSINYNPGQVSTFVNKHAVGNDQSGYVYGLWRSSEGDLGLLNFHGPPHFDVLTYASEPQGVVQPSVWNSAIVTYQDDLDLLSYYLNGDLIDTITISLNIDENAHNLIFGASGFGGSQANWSYYNGTLDDIAIYNRALTPAEVQELYTVDACTFTVYDTLTVENIINVYDTLTIENIVDIYDTTYINVEVYDTLTVENIINVYDTLTIENVIDVFDTTTVVETVVVFDTLTVENVIDVFDTTTVVETVVVFDTLTVENVIDVFDTTTVVETVVVFDTLTVENVIDVYDTTTVVETVVVFDTLTVENVIDVYDTTYVTVTDTLIIDIPSGVGGTILNTLLLYPNPTSDQLTISYGNFAAMAGYSLSIFDNGGSAVHETTITQAQETLDITQWSAGVYLVVVYNAGGVPVETRQIVIQ